MPLKRSLSMSLPFVAVRDSRFESLSGVRMASLSSIAPSKKSARRGGRLNHRWAGLERKAGCEFSLPFRRVR
jgi:hypothetical protein